ncbi:von Willebrand factor type A domain-containing protein [Halopelagius inordinatus]|uniref:von Willebrand factor type A domain-containing protein n=1 Tax=Halopelagius inordinatus TaxID=553467 RepID=A0A1I2UQ17_9EURY|nr:VWA domain-containing protein [Halopelagius inordinatus]SFG76881.1 von Willebrand factor type A domain-containing protein [Halopelagius inordinatus]
MSDGLAGSGDRVERGREESGGVLGRIPRRTVLKSAVLGVGLHGFSARAAAQSDSTAGFVDVLSADPSNYPSILVNVSVDTDAGRNGNLSREDFQITEAGVEKAIQSFRFTSASADIVFLFDDTGSMDGEIADMQAGVKGLTDEIEAAGIDARYSLVTFKDSVETDLEFTDDASALKSRTDRLTASAGGDGPEDNFDAIVRALGLDFRPEAQKIVVDITDSVSHYRGDGSGVSDYTIDEVQTMVEESGVAYVAVAPATTAPESSKRALAERTGGLWMEIRSADFSRILERIERLVVTTYVVEYLTDTAPNESNDLTVTVTDPDRGTGSDETTVDVPSGKVDRDALVRSTGDTRAFYEMAVTGEMRLGENSDPKDAEFPDSVEGSTAIGSVAGGGTDGLRFSGEVTNVRVGGPAEFEIDGESVGGDTVESMNTIAISSTEDRRAYYDVRASDRIYPGERADVEKMESPEPFPGSEVTGSVAERGTDEFYFTGRIDHFSLDGPADVSVNGERVDPSEVTSDDESDSNGGDDSGGGELDDELRIVSTADERAFYEITVDGEIEPGDRANLTGADYPDSVEGRTASGSVAKGGIDSFRFSGEILDVRLDGPADVLVNGDRYTSGGA